MTAPAVDPRKPIASVEELGNHLHQAAQLELSTIPLYLYAAYSIQTASYSQWAPGISAFRAIRSVVIEEMLHLSLVRNLMVAIGQGDHIRFYDDAVVPTYPAPMLHRVPTLMLHLEPCSQQLMRTVFMPLELPEKTHAQPQPDRYNTIGQFYEAIEQGFERLAGELGPGLWADNRPELQYSRAYWNQDGGGSPVVVTDLPTALDAMRTIVEQGEGIAPHRATVPLDPVSPKLGLDELSHYAKFRRIAEGVDEIGDVRPLPTDPKLDDYDGPVRDLAELANAAYAYVLCLIDAVYAASSDTRQPGQHSERYGLERAFIAAMGGLLFGVADLLARHGAGPTFEFYAFREGTPRKAQLAALCDALLGSFPSLGGDNGVRRLIERLPSV
jgi:hypothetical protein